MANVKTYSSVLADLKNRSTLAKAASTKKADDPKSVPEKDPTDNGTVTIPKDPNATPAAEQMPESKTNADGTPVYVAPPAKVVDGPEKMATMTAKAAKMLTSIQALRKSAGGKAEEIANQGSLPAAANKNAPKQPLATPAPAPAAGKADPAVKTAPMPAEDPKGGIPKETPNKEASADVDLSNIDHTFFSKLAQTCMQFKEGQEMMEACLKKAHGAEHATNLIKTAVFVTKKMQELTELEESGATAAEEFWKSASESEKAGLIKLASTHQQALASLETSLEQEAYLEGAKIAADMADAGMTGEQPPPNVPGMGGEGDPAAAPGAEGGEVSDDDIIQALQLLIQQGKITEEEAEAILQQLLGGQGGAEAGGPPGAGGPPPGVGAPEGADKAPEPGPEEKEAAAHFNTVGQAVDAVFASLVPAKTA